MNKIENMLKDFFLYQYNKMVDNNPILSTIPINEKELERNIINFVKKQEEE